MSQQNGNGKITDPHKLQEMLRSNNPAHQKEAVRRMDEQAQRALRELELQMLDLVCQVLGFKPTAEQRKNHGDIERKKSGRLIFYWDGEAFLKLDPIKAEPVVMRVGDKKQKIKFSQDYHILKDDPTGYKFRNPDDNYVVNHYPDRDEGDDIIRSS